MPAPAALARGASTAAAGRVTVGPALDATAPLARTTTRQTRPRSSKDSPHMGQLKTGSSDQGARAAGAGAAPTRGHSAPRSRRVRSCASNASPFETTNSPNKNHNKMIKNCCRSRASVPGCCWAGRAPGLRITVVTRRRQKWPNQRPQAKKQHGNPSNVSNISNNSPHMGQRRSGAAGERAAMRSATKVGRE